MAVSKDKEKALAKAKQREKARARKAVERELIRATPEWSAEFRQEFVRLLATVGREVPPEQLETMLEDTERQLFLNKLKPVPAAQEAFRAVNAILERQHDAVPDASSVRFNIREDGNTRFVIFDHYQVRIIKGANGRLDYALDGLDDVDQTAFNDIVELAQSLQDGEYYLHGAAASEYYLRTTGEPPTPAQLSTMARQLYRNKKFTTRVYR